MKVVISGYYGFGNVGDEAVLVSLLQELKEVQATVLSATPTLTAELNKVRSIGRYDFPLVIRELAGADVLISGGGTLFQDVTSSRSFWYYIGLVLLAKIMRKKVMVMAQGFGPLRHWANRLMARVILNLVDLITLRDDESFHEIMKLGVTSTPVFVTADPVALLNKPELMTGKHILSLEGIETNKPLVGIAIRNLPGKKAMEEKVSRALAQALDRLQAERGIRPVFLIFQNPEDTRESQQVAGLMASDSSTVFRLCRPEEMLALFPHCRLVIGMRLHSLVFAAMSGVPLIGLSYDPKVESFLNFLGQPEVKIDQRLDVDSFIRELEYVFANETRIKQELAEKIERLRYKARLNFELFFVLLRSDWDKQAYLCKSLLERSKIAHDEHRANKEGAVK